MRKGDAGERVSVEQAAKEIGCCVEYLRRQMKSGEWKELGYVVKPKRGEENYQYFIFRPRLNKFIGIEEAQDEKDRGCHDGGRNSNVRTGRMLYRLGRDLSLYGRSRSNTGDSASMDRVGDQRARKEKAV